MKHDRHYDNLYVDFRYGDQIDRCLIVDTKCDSITEAKRIAKRHGGFAVRAYYSDDTSYSYYKVFYPGYKHD